MGIADLFAEIMASSSFTRAHAEAPEEDRESKDDEADNENEAKSEDAGATEEEGEDAVEKDAGGDIGEEEEEEEEGENDEEPVDPKPKFEEGEPINTSTNIPRVP